MKKMATNARTFKLSPPFGKNRQHLAVSIFASLHLGFLMSPHIYHRARTISIVIKNTHKNSEQRCAHLDVVLQHDATPLWKFAPFLILELSSDDPPGSHYEYDAIKIKSAYGGIIDQLLGKFAPLHIIPNCVTQLSF